MTQSEVLETQPANATTCSPLTTIDGNSLARQRPTWHMPPVEPPIPDPALLSPIPDPRSLMYHQTNTNAIDPAGKSLERAHRAHAAERTDAAVRRPAPRPRSDDARRRSTCCASTAGRCAFPERTFATVDHIVPTSSQQRPFLDVMAEEMTVGARAQLPRVRHPAAGRSTATTRASST